jgi:hypothetical protein
MPYILIKNKPFEEYAYDNEDELENAVVNNKEYIFGESTVLIDYKRKVGAKDSKNIGIPDGFLIDFSNPNKPQLFYIEYELESHQLYEHIGPQIMRFYASFETGKRQLQKKLINIIKQDKKLNNEIITKLKSVSFDNVDSLLNNIIYDRNLGIIVVIDDQTEDFNSLLRRFSEVPEVIVVKKYQYKNEVVLQYDPFREGITKIVTSKKKKKLEPEEIDTIVCPAREDGFNYAFLENNYWGEIRISPSIIPQLKHIAMYQTLPYSEINWIADIKQNGIQPYKNSGRYLVNVENKKKIKPITLDKDIKGIAPQSPRYTTYKKLKAAKKISELW